MIDQISERLPQLPYPVYFVHKNKKVWEDWVENSSVPDVEDVVDRFRSGSDSYSINGYIALKKMGLDVHLTSQFVPGKICVTTYEDLAIKDFPFNSYVVACRTDRGRPEICEQRIVQNKLNIIDETDHYLTHWPQPGILPRDPERGSRVENVVYLGRECNLAAPFREPAFAKAVQEFGINFIVRSPDLEEAGYKLWSDYRDVDVVFAARSMTAYNLSIKPPSKLVNTWLAGSAAILGPEPAYQQLWQSELDYMEVSTVAEAIAAIRRLKNDPALYSSMLENGAQRAKSFQLSSIVKQWRDLLATDIAQGYERWCQQSLLFKSLGRPLQFGYRALKHKQEKKYFINHIFNGEKMFSSSENIVQGNPNSLTEPSVR